MCLAVPGKIIGKKGNAAEVDFDGVRRKVSLDLLPEARKGDYVLVHAGFAIEKLKEEEALRTIRMFEEING